MSECPEGVIGGGHEPVCARCGRDMVPAPIDWPARFRAAAEVAEGRYLCGQLQVSAYYLENTPPAVVEAIGRALLGEQR